MRIELPELTRPNFEMIIPIRWGDMDAYGHVNNTVYFRYLKPCGSSGSAARARAWCGKAQARSWSMPLQLLPAAGVSGRHPGLALRGQPWPLQFRCLRDAVQGQPARRGLRRGRFDHGVGGFPAAEVGALPPMSLSFWPATRPETGGGPDGLACWFARGLGRGRPAGACPGYLAGKADRLSASSWAPGRMRALSLAAPHACEVGCWFLTPSQQAPGDIPPRASHDRIPVPHQGPSQRAWVREAIARIEAGRPALQRHPPDRLVLPRVPGIDIYFRTSPATHGQPEAPLGAVAVPVRIVQRVPEPGSTVVESSSGSTAVSGSLFRASAGLAVRGRDAGDRLGREDRGDRVLWRGSAIWWMTHHHLQRIPAPGGRARGPPHGPVHLRRAGDRLAGEQQHRREHLPADAKERHPVPRWLVSAGGTGGTTATLGRYVRYAQHETGILCADAERSVFFDYFVSRDASLCMQQGSRIEGDRTAPGRGLVHSSDHRRHGEGARCLVPGRHARVVPSAGPPVGPSTGTNLVATLAAAQAMRDAGGGDPSSRCCATRACDIRTPATTVSGWPHRGSLATLEQTQVAKWMDQGLPAALSQAWRLAGDWR